MAHPIQWTNAFDAVRRYALVVRCYWLLPVLLLISITGISAQERRAEIRGHVLSWAEQPIVGAHVRIMNTAGVNRSAITGPDGSYSIGDLDSGVYDLEVTAFGFNRVEIRRVVLRKAEASLLSAIRPAVGLIADCGSTRPTYYYPSGGGGTGAIGGVVISDKNATIPNAAVTLYVRGKGTIATTLTDGEGRFSFSGLQLRREEYLLTIGREGMFSEEVGHLEIQPGFEAVYDPITLESCTPGRCAPHLKTIRVIPGCA